MSALSKGTIVSRPELIKRGLRKYHISMDSILFLEALVHFYSYTRYMLLCMRDRTL